MEGFRGRWGDLRALRASEVDGRASKATRKALEAAGKALEAAGRDSVRECK